jgi:hypothetical protein
MIPAIVRSLAHETISFRLSQVILCHQPNFVHFADERDGSVDGDDATETNCNKVKRKSSVKKKPHHPVSRHDSTKDSSKNENETVCC